MDFQYSLRYLAARKRSNPAWFAKKAHNTVLDLAPGQEVSQTELAALTTGAYGDALRLDARGEDKVYFAFVFRDFKNKGQHNLAGDSSLPLPFNESFSLPRSSKAALGFALKKSSMIALPDAGGIFPAGAGTGAGGGGTGASGCLGSLALAIRASGSASDLCRSRT
jgi:hypothetical protein